MSCDCEDCRSLCKTTPGWPHPDQIASIAKFLGISVEKLLKEYFILHGFRQAVAYFGPDDHDVLTLRTVQELERYEFKRTFIYEFIAGPCVLLREQGCKLPYDLRPVICRESYACKNICGGRSFERKELENEILKAWWKRLDLFKMYYDSIGLTRRQIFNQTNLTEKIRNRYWESSETHWKNNWDWPKRLDLW